MGKRIEHLENNENWKVTAKDAEGNLYAICTGVKGSEREAFYYLYEENWYPGGVMQPFSLDEIKEMFSSGKLQVVRGNIPESA